MNASDFKLSKSVQAVPTNECGHSKRRHYARGLCLSCYDRFKVSGDFVSRGTVGRVNECGHSDRRHHSHGLCRQCAVKRLWRLEPSGVYVFNSFGGERLYVGSTRSLYRRLANHKHSSSWYSEVDESRTVAIPTPSWAQAQFIETTELARNPGKYNKIGANL